VPLDPTEGGLAEEGERKSPQSLFFWGENFTRNDDRGKVKRKKGSLSGGGGCKPVALKQDKSKKKKRLPKG